MENTPRAAWATFLLSMRNSYNESHTQVPRCTSRKFYNSCLGYYSQLHTWPALKAKAQAQLHFRVRENTYDTTFLF